MQKKINDSFKQFMRFEFDRTQSMQKLVFLMNLMSELEFLDENFENWSSWNENSLQKGTFRLFVLVN